MQYAFGFGTAWNARPATTYDTAQTIPFLTRWHNWPAAWTADAISFDYKSADTRCHFGYTNPKTYAIPAIWNW
jgi:hypothetical protein